MQDLSPAELKRIRGGFLAWGAGLLAGWMGRRYTQEHGTDAWGGGESGGGGASLTY